MLLVKKSEVERQLKLRQSELRFLQRLQGYLVGSEGGGWEWEREELGEVMIQKDEEVKRLQKQLSGEWMSPTRGFMPDMRLPVLM